MKLLRLANNKSYQDFNNSFKKILEMDNKKGKLNMKMLLILLDTEVNLEKEEYFDTANSVSQVTASRISTDKLTKLLLGK